MTLQEPGTFLLICQERGELLRPRVDANGVARTLRVATTSTTFLTVVVTSRRERADPNEVVTTQLRLLVEKIVGLWM